MLHEKVDPAATGADSLDSACTWPEKEAASTKQVNQLQDRGAFAQSTIWYSL
jgi:hypothetical protein